MHKWFEMLPQMKIYGNTHKRQIESETKEIGTHFHNTNCVNGSTLYIHCCIFFFTMKWNEICVERRASNAKKVNEMKEMKRFLCAFFRCFIFACVAIRMVIMEQSILYDTIEMKTWYENSWCNMSIAITFICSKTHTYTLEWLWRWRPTSKLLKTIWILSFLCQTKCHKNVNSMSFRLVLARIDACNLFSLNGILSHCLSVCVCLNKTTKD